MDMAEILTMIGSIVQAVVGWVEYIITLVTAQPILMLFCVGVPLCGLAVGYLKRLIRV